MYSKQNNTRHTEFAQIPCDVPNTALTSSLRKVPTTAVHQRNTQSQDRGASRQGAATRRTVLHCICCSRVTSHSTKNTGCRIAVPIRRSVRSSLKQQVGQSQTWSSPRFTILNSTDTHNQLFQHVSQGQSQSRVDVSPQIAKWRCAAATRNTAMKPRWPTATMHRTHSNELVHTFPSLVPVFPSGRFRHFLERQSHRSASLTNVRSHNPLVRTTGFETS